MTGHSHEVEIELFNNSSDDGKASLDTHDDSSSLEEPLSPDQDLPEEFVSCSQSLASRDSLDQDRDFDSSGLPDGSGKSLTIQSSLASSYSASVDGNSTATLRPSQAQAREVKKLSARTGESNEELDVNNGAEPAITISSPENSSDDTTIPDRQNMISSIYVGGLKAIREIDSDSARSPTLASPTVANTAYATQKPKAMSRGSISVLDRFGRDVWLHHNEDDETDEVRFDEDGNYYVFGDEGFRVILKPGQIQSDGTSQSFCISNGKRVNINIIADRLRISALQDPKPATDEPPITPRTEVLINNSSKNSPLASPLRKPSHPPLKANPIQKPRTHQSRNPWAGIFTGVAQKSKAATSYLTKGARTKRRSSTAESVELQQRAIVTSRTNSGTSSADKSALGTGIEAGETQGRRIRLPFRGHGQGSRGTPVVNIKKIILLRRS